MAFPGFNFYGGDFGLDTYGGEEGGFSAFGNPPEDWMPDLSGATLPLQPQRTPLSGGDLYQGQPEAPPTIAMPTPAQMADLTPEQRQQLRADIILQVGMAFSQGANSRGPGIAASLGEAAQNVQGGREQMLAQETARRETDWQAQIAEATARQQQAQAEAQGAKERQAANSLAGMANKVAEAEPALADLADTYARMGQMDDLASLYQKLPDYAAARAAGFDPLAQPDWRKVVADREAQAQKEAEAEAQRAADFEDWKRRQEMERGMSREDLQWRASHGLLFAPSGPERPERPQTIETPTGVFERGPGGRWTPASGIPAYPQKAQPEERRPPLPRIIQDGLNGKKYYEIVDPETGQPTGELRPVIPEEPVKKKGWFDFSELDRPREAPTAGPDTRPAASSGEGGKAQVRPNPEQVDRKLSLVRQSFGSLTPEQEAFVRAELRAGRTAQSILARIRMAAQGGPRA
jgi:hypothetical protein